MRPEVRARMRGGQRLPARHGRLPTGAAARLRPLTTRHLERLQRPSGRGRSVPAGPSAGPLWPASQKWAAGMPAALGIRSGSTSPPRDRRVCPKAPARRDAIARTARCGLEGRPRCALRSDRSWAGVAGPPALRPTRPSRSAARRRAEAVASEGVRRKPWRTSGRCCRAHRANRSPLRYGPSRRGSGACAVHPKPPASCAMSSATLPQTW